MNIIDVAIDDIRVGMAFRKDMGDIDGLAQNIAKLGLLHAIGITANKRLVFGARRLAAHRKLGRAVIPAHVLDIESIAEGAYAENVMRKDFTVSERAAIMEMVEAEIGKRQGARTDLELRADRPEVNGIRVGDRTRNVSAQRAGLSSGRVGHRVQFIIKKGVPELIAAMDNDDIAIDAAYLLARTCDKDRQREIVQLPPGPRKAVLADMRGTDRPSRRAPAKTNQPTPAPAARKQVEPPALYRSRLSLEEQGFPPRETWDEPDPDRPGLTRMQGHVAKHGHVHVMPLHVRQAQDNRIAARRLNSQIRELAKQPLASLLRGDPPPIALGDLATTLDAMAGVDVSDGASAERIIERLSATLAEIMPDITRAYDYLTALHEIVRERQSRQPEPAAPEVSITPQSDAIH
jgi:ParB-like chromosome segregation protein Spo0J